jgi:hypothetical protein
LSDIPTTSPSETTLAKSEGAMSVCTTFKVQTVERKTYLLRYDDETDEWTPKSESI